MVRVSDKVRVSIRVMAGVRFLSVTLSVTLTLPIIQVSLDSPGDRLLGERRSKSLRSL